MNLGVVDLLHSIKVEEEVDLVYSMKVEVDLLCSMKVEVEVEVDQSQFLVVGNSVFLHHHPSDDDSGGGAFRLGIPLLIALIFAVRIFFFICSLFGREFFH